MSSPEHGYQATTVRKSSSAPVPTSRRSTYHFGDKLGLYTEVLQQSVRAARVDAINSALDRNAPLEEILRAVIGARLQSSPSQICRTGTFESWCIELVQPTPALSRVVNEVSRPIYKRLLELIGGIIDLPPSMRRPVCAHTASWDKFCLCSGRSLLKQLWPELE